MSWVCLERMRKTSMAAICIETSLCLLQSKDLNIMAASTSSSISAADFFANFPIDRPGKIGAKFHLDEDRKENVSFRKIL